MAFLYFLINYGRQFRAKSKPKDEKYKDLLIDLLKSPYDGKILDFLLEHPLELLIGKLAIFSDGQKSPEKRPLNGALKTLYRLPIETK